MCISQLFSSLDPCRNHSSHFSFALISEHRGHNKILSLALSILKLIKYVTPKNLPSYQRAKWTQHFIFDMRSTYNFMFLPADLERFYGKCKRFKTKREGDNISQAFLRKLIRIFEIFQDALDLVDDGIFTPILLLDKVIGCMGKTAQMIGQSWRILGLAKSLLLVASNIGRIVLGCKHPIERAFSIVLEGCECIVSILHFCSIRLHPIILIVLSLAQSLFGLVQIWNQTS